MNEPNADMGRNNPIATTLDQAIPAMSQDKRRPVEGFIQLASHSVEFQAMQRRGFQIMVEQEGSLSQKLFGLLNVALWYGFESGKAYAMNGSFDRLLALEDEHNARVAETIQREIKEATQA